jgi:hypothetical protein
MKIKTRLFRKGRCQETVVLSPTGGAWRSVRELQDWALRTFGGRCGLLENGATIAEDLGRDVRRFYEITMI